MYRTFNSQVAAFIRHCMDEELHTIYVLEMQQTQIKFMCYLYSNFE